MDTIILSISLDGHTKDVIFTRAVEGSSYFSPPMFFARVNNHTTVQTCMAARLKSEHPKHWHTLRKYVILEGKEWVYYLETAARYPIIGWR